MNTTGLFHKTLSYISKKYSIRFDLKRLYTAASTISIGLMLCA